MAIAREVEFYVDNHLNRGQLILLSQDGVDRLAAQDLEFVVAPEMRIRPVRDIADWLTRDVVSNSKDIEHPVPFNSREIADTLAGIITRRANELRRAPKK